MLEERQSGQDAFRSVLMTVVGQAYGGAGYQLEEMPLQWIAGRYCFSKPLAEGRRGVIDYQVLIYSENAYVNRMPSRFRVTLQRAPGGVSRTLAQLVVEDFGVAILPSADHWWQFNDMVSLGKALAEAGHLVVGYGIPWLDGSLVPPQRDGA